MLKPLGFFGGMIRGGGVCHSGDYERFWCIDILVNSAAELRIEEPVIQIGPTMT